MIHHSSVNNFLLVNFLIVIMADFAAMMREEIAARAAKSAAEKFRQEMDAFYGITPSPQIPIVGPFIDSPVDVVEVMITTPFPVTSTILPDIILPETSTQLNSELVVSIPVATTPSPDILVTLSSVVTSTEIPVIPVDPIDSKRFDTPLPKVIRKNKIVKTAALPDSPDMSSLQADLARRRQQWRQKKMQTDMQRKENDLSLSTYGVAQSITPSQIVVPVMPEYSTVVTPSMATETMT